jgi:hypothetical protein
MIVLIPETYDEAVEGSKRAEASSDIEQLKLKKRKRKPNRK